MFGSAILELLYEYSLDLCPSLHLSFSPFLFPFPRESVALLSISHVSRILSLKLVSVAKCRSIFRGCKLLRGRRAGRCGDTGGQPSLPVSKREQRYASGRREIAGFRSRQHLPCRKHKGVLGGSRQLVSSPNPADITPLSKTLPQFKSALEALRRDLSF